MALEAGKYRRQTSGNCWPLHSKSNEACLEVMTPAWAAPRIARPTPKSVVDFMMRVELTFQYAKEECAIAGALEE